MRKEVICVEDMAVKCDTLLVTYSDDSVQVFNAAKVLKDREEMGNSTFSSVYGFDVDKGWLKKAIENS